MIAGMNRLELFIQPKWDKPVCLKRIRGGSTADYLHSPRERRPTGTNAEMLVELCEIVLSQEDGVPSDHNGEIAHQ